MKTGDALDIGGRIARVRYGLATIDHHLRNGKYESAMGACGGLEMDVASLCKSVWQAASETKVGDDHEDETH